jgi:hypothetical protein
MQRHQALTDLRRGIWIKLAPLCIAEKIVESLIATFFVVISRMVSQITAVAHTIIDWAAIRTGLLLRRVVSVVLTVVGLSVATIRGLVHLVTMVIVTCSCSCEILQVSNY